MDFAICGVGMKVKYKKLILCISCVSATMGFEAEKFTLI
jgi:hypothetical protein